MKIIFFVCFVCFVIEVSAQGCSDAGFCTLGALKPNQSFDKNILKNNHSFEIGHNFGISQTYEYISTFYIDGSIKIGDKNTIQLKMPFVIVQGDITQTSGIGDFSVSYTRNLIAGLKNNVNFSVGFIFPTGESNIKFEQKSLPMTYQTGLGTYDFIVGVSWVNQGWLLALGYQQPYKNVNKNEFLFSDWSNFNGDISKYTQSNKLVRGNDILFRIEKNIRFINWNINLSYLPIYRLKSDEIVLTDASIGELMTTKIPNSEGLAMSINLGIKYFLNAKSNLQLIQSVGLTQNNGDSDGKNRHFVSVLSYGYNF